MDKNKFDLWVLSTKVWKESASVTRFMEEEIDGLRDANGDALPDAVKKFFLDLLYCRIKPRRGRFLPRDSIKEQYKMLRFGPPVEPKAEIVQADFARALNVSSAVIDQIVSPRKSRKPRKS